MSGLFSSPGKQAQQGASGYQAQAQNIISELEKYTGQQQQAERGAIAGIGANPYFQAATAMNPGAYRVNPGGVQTFGGTGGPGTFTAQPGAQSAGVLPPPWRPPIDGPGSGAPGGGHQMQPGGPGGGGEKQPGYMNNVLWNPQDHRYESLKDYGNWSPGANAPDVMKMLPVSGGNPTGGGGQFGGLPGRGHGSP